MSSLITLPEEVLYQILRMLNKRDLKNLLQTSKNFNAMNDSFSSNLTLFNTYKVAPNTHRDYTDKIDSFFVDYSGQHLLELYDSNFIIANDNTISLTDRKKCQSLIKIIAHEKPISAMAVLNKDLFFTASLDATIKLWQSSDLKMVKQFNEHVSTVSSIIVHDNILISASWDRTIILRNLVNDTSVVYKKHMDWVRALISLDKTLFASASNDGQLIIWQTNKTDPVKILSKKTSIHSLALLNKKTIVSGSGNGEIDLWDWENDNPMRATKKISSKAIKKINPLNDDTLISYDAGGSIFLLTITENTILSKKINCPGIQNFECLDNGYIATCRV